MSKRRGSLFVTLVMAALVVGTMAPTARAVSLAEGGGTAAVRASDFAARELVPIRQPYPPHARITETSAQEKPAALGETTFVARNASSGLSLVGAVTFSAGGSGVRMTVDKITNTRSSGTSGTLRLVLWATTTVPVFGNTISAYTLGTYTLGQLNAGSEYDNVDTGFVPFTPPPTGCFYVTISLQEFQSDSVYHYVDLVTADTGGFPDGSGFDLFSFGGANCSGTASCVRNASTACLLNGRFQVRVTYRSSTATGNGQVMSFGGARAESDESAFLWFFDPSNFEMGLKMLNACSLNNKFWVFISGLTNQGWTVNILDTQTGRTATYSNALNHLTSTTADTSALPCP